MLRIDRPRHLALCLLIGPSTWSTAVAAVSFDLLIASEISRTEAFNSSAPAATCPIMLLTFSPCSRAITWAVVSAAYLTTLYGLPLISRIGL